MEIIKVILIVGFVIGLTILGYCLSGWIFMLLWNWVLVDLFSAPIISFWQSLGIIILLSFISGMFKITINNK